MRTATVLLWLTLTGCSGIIPASFDNNEYMLVNQIRTQAVMYQKQCADSNQSRDNYQSLYNSAVEFSNYTQYLKRNSATHQMSLNLLTLISNGADLYNTQTTVSVVFCELNLEQVSSAAENIQKSTGTKPK
jgi:hypothetical protein